MLGHIYVGFTKLKYMEKKDMHIRDSYFSIKFLFYKILNTLVFIYFDFMTQAYSLLYYVYIIRT